MLRRPYASERIQRVDPETGIKVVQLTSYPLPAVHLNYNWPSVSPDGRRVILMSQRYAGRRAPWDLFRVDTDGLNLFQLTERTDTGNPVAQAAKQNAPVCIMNPDGRTLYAVWHGDPHVYAVDVETGNIETLGSFSRFAPDGAVIQHMLYSPTSDRLFIVLRHPRITTYRFDIATGEVAELDLDGLLWACYAEKPRIVLMKQNALPKEKLADYVSFVRETGGTRTFWDCNEDGGDARLIGRDVFAHGTLLGRTERLQGCGNPPERCIWILEPGGEPRRLCSGPYFWHSGASFDGEWIVADTNWPDRGLQLIHVGTGHFRTLCHPRATLDHTPAGHPHPALSQDGRVAVFGSDRTGVSQVYAAHILDEFRQSVIAGELDRPRDKWWISKR